jgi:hypothetical protein
MMKRDVLAEPVDLGNDICMEVMPEWTPDALQGETGAYPDLLSVGHSEFVLTARYHANALGDPDPSQSGGEPSSIQSVATGRIVLANVSLWFAHPSSLNFKWLIHFERNGGKWMWREVIPSSRLIPNKKDEYAELNSDDLQNAKKLAETINDLTREGPVWTAIRLAWMALTSRHSELRYLLPWPQFRLHLV